MAAPVPCRGPARRPARTTTTTVVTCTAIATTSHARADNLRSVAPLFPRVAARSILNAIQCVNNTNPTRTAANSAPPVRSARARPAADRNADLSRRTRPGRIASEAIRRTGAKTIGMRIESQMGPVKNTLRGCYRARSSRSKETDGPFGSVSDDEPANSARPSIDAHHQVRPPLAVRLVPVVSKPFATSEQCPARGTCPRHQTAGRVVVFCKTRSKYPSVLVPFGSTAEVEKRFGVTPRMHDQLAAEAELADLKDGLRIAPFERQAYSMTSPPIVVNGIVVVGSSIADNRQEARRRR